MGARVVMTVTMTACEVAAACIAAAVDSNGDSVRTSLRRLLLILSHRRNSRRCGDVGHDDGDHCDVAAARIAAAADRSTLGVARSSTNGAPTLLRPYATSLQQQALHDTHTVSDECDRRTGSASAAQIATLLRPPATSMSKH